MDENSIKYDNKIRIIDLPLIEITGNGENQYIDASKFYSNGTEISSFNLNISHLSAQNLLLNNAAAKKYRTEENELKGHDLELFSEYEQNAESTKNTYFEYHPFVDSIVPNDRLQPDQLLTLSNVAEFDNYMSLKKLQPYACIPSFNYETDRTDTGIDYRITSNNFKQFITSTTEHASATYKFEYTLPYPENRNTERVTNVVPLNIFKYNNDEIVSIVHYTVAGIVAIKSNVSTLRSGTIYLEARKAGSTNDDDWQVIDSAVFKFLPNGISPGTYITLTGFLSTEFETRLKLNLKSKGYSMNLSDFRQPEYALTNHNVNTFIGFAHIPNMTSTDENMIYYSDENYKDYRQSGVKSKKLEHIVEGSSKKMVSALLNEFEEDLHKTNLQIYANGMYNASGFEINGLRLSPTGPIYGLDSTIEVKPGNTYYPSYASGVITVDRSETSCTAHYESDCSDIWASGEGHVYGNSDVDFTSITTLDGVTWPADTEILGELDSEISLRFHYTSSKQYTKTVKTNGTSTINVPGTFSVSGFAMEKNPSNPKQHLNQQNIFKVDFSNKLKNIQGIYGAISVYMYAWPSTWGPGRGNESYGRVYSGNGVILDKTTFKTKNLKHGVDATNHMCSPNGGRWNMTPQQTYLTCTQSNENRYLTLWEWTDTAADDGFEKTCFSVSISGLKVKYKYKNSTTTTTTHTIDERHTYSGHLSATGVNCYIGSKKIHATDNHTSIGLHDNRLDNKDEPITSNTEFHTLTATGINFKRINDGVLANRTVLTVCPYPQVLG